MIVKNMSPSSLYFVAYLTAAMFNALFDIAYPENLVTPVFRANFADPRPDPIIMHFFVIPARRSGRNALITWIVPRVFVLYFDSIEKDCFQRRCL